MYLYRDVCVFAVLAYESLGTLSSSMVEFQVILFFSFGQMLRFLWHSKVRYVLDFFQWFGRERQYWPFIVCEVYSCINRSPTESMWFTVSLMILTFKKQIQYTHHHYLQAFTESSLLSIYTFSINLVYIQRYF